MKRCLTVVALTFPWTTSSVVWILAVDFKVDQVSLAAARNQSRVSAKVHLCISVLVTSPFQDWKKAQKRCVLFSPSALQRLTLLHVNSNQCLDMPSEEDKMVPTLRDCNNGRSQQWLLRNMTLSIWSSPQPPTPLTPAPASGALSFPHDPRPLTPPPGGCDICLCISLDRMQGLKPQPVPLHHAAVSIFSCSGGPRSLRRRFPMKDERAEKVITASPRLLRAAVLAAGQTTQKRSIIAVK